MLIVKPPPAPGRLASQLHEIEAVSTTGIYDDKVIRPACLGFAHFSHCRRSSALAQSTNPPNPAAGPAVGKVFGWAGSLSTSGCTKNTDAREGVHKAEAFVIAPIPQHRLRVEFGQLFFASGHSKQRGKTRFARQGKTQKLGVRGLPLLACPERQGSGGIQPADGWAWFQGRHAFEIGLQGMQSLGQDS